MRPAFPTSKALALSGLRHLRLNSLFVIALALSSQSCGTISGASRFAPSPVVAPQGLTQKLSISDLQASDVSPQSPLTADTPPGSEPNDSAVLDEMPSPSESLVVETGLASWYGPRFHGKLTASGEVYNQEGFTAAHRTLAWGDKVRVTNLRNGRSVVVQINDRGPAIKDRIIDLSRAAARALGMLQSGTARVKLTRLSTSERPGPVLAKQYFKD